jgi:hypothetical protein
MRRECAHLLAWAENENLDRPDAPVAPDPKPRIITL